MFLIGGPAFSGTTLLAFLLTQGELLCLDEPDFHNPQQRHRGIPFLKELFPDRLFPEPPIHELSHREAVFLIGKCEQVLTPLNLGMKTCDWTLLRYAEVYRDLGYPVIAIIRDIRDALVRPLPEGFTEETLNDRYRLIWKNLKNFDLWVRYEDLVHAPEKPMKRISEVLDYPLEVLHTWSPQRVHEPMLKLDRHEALRDGKIIRDRVGIWKTSGKVFSSESHQTARAMGY